MLKNIYNALERPHLSRFGYLVQKLILLNILLNVASFMISFFFHPNANIVSLIGIVANVTVIIFIVELLARYIVIGQDPRYRGVIGRIKYTFSLYIMIDIIALIPYFVASISADVMLIRVLRFIRFLRILKLMRMKKFIKKFLSINSFASSTITMQIIVLFTLSLLIILLFSYTYSSAEHSVLIFMDPTYITESNGYIELFLGVLELIVGLFIGGALISIITSTLVNITNVINNGYLPYKEREHIIIISHNSKLEFIMDEANKYFRDKGEEQDIVLFLPNISDISSYKTNIDDYDSLDITYITGDALNWNSYERININSAQKILMLLDTESEIKNQNRKISRFILTNPHFDNKELSFVIETKDITYSADIYRYIFDGITNRYSLIDNKDLIAKFLNRSIVNHDYFQIFSELLSFDGNEFYEIKASDVFDESLSFERAYMHFTNGVLVGVVKDNKLVLNPNSEILVEADDTLIAVLEDVYAYELESNIDFKLESQRVEKPHLKENKNICIVGDFSDIHIEDITHFLTDKSVKNSLSLVPEDGDYLKREIWDDLEQRDLDIIILNLEDEYEFALTLYLKSLYKDKPEFLEKLINIIHDPVTALLIQGSEQNKNIILSKKIIGEYITQILFNPSIADIFDEITQAKGSELYVLDFEEYEALRVLEYKALKYNLVKNGMIYMGGFVENEFVFDLKDVKKASRIVVLAEGI